MASQLQQQLERERQEKAGLQGEVQAAGSRCCALEAKLQELTAALHARQEEGQQQEAARVQEREQWQQQLKQQQAEAQSQVRNVALMCSG